LNSYFTAQTQNRYIIQSFRINLAFIVHKKITGGERERERRDWIGLFKMIIRLCQLCGVCQFLPLY